MREIKFRAWKDDNMYYEFFDGNLRDHPLGINEMIKSCENEEMKIMQYTGLKDKNGKEIYEGDIVKQMDMVMEVKFRLGCFFFCTKGDNEEPHNPNATDFHHAIKQYMEKGHKPFELLEIIGNIHKNPELLNKLWNYKY